MVANLGQYRILDRIGTGGIGDVYRARDTRHGRTVAIKVLSAELKDGPRRARLFEQADVLTRVSHPNIAALYEVGEAEGLAYLVFEYVPGDSLKTTISGRPLNPRRAVDFATQIADALAEAHADNVVHHDLKPDTIIITPKGNAKILDFGLAPWTRGGAARDRAAGAAGKTTTGSTTVPYMSPEQASEGEADHRTDIFSLGVILFEMLTGKLPFGTVRAAAAAGAPPVAAPSVVNPSVPPELDPIVARATARQVEDRYDSAAALAAELRSVAAILDVRAGTLEPRSFVTLKPARGRPWVLVVLAIVAALALVWIAVRAF